MPAFLLTCPLLPVYMFLAARIFDPPRVRFCTTADMKAGGLAIVESDDLLTAPMESATNDLQMLSLPSGFLPLPASSQGLLGLTEDPPTRHHPTKPASSTFCFLLASAGLSWGDFLACRLSKIITILGRFISVHCISSICLCCPNFPLVPIRQVAQ